MNVYTSTPLKLSLKSVFHYFWGSCRVGFIMGAGDILAQQYYSSKRIENIDWIRTAKYVSIGFCFVGPALTYWTQIMNPWMVTQRSYISLVARQILGDQLFLSPSLNIGLLLLTGMVNMETREELEKRVNANYVCLMKRHYTFWPAVQLFSSVFIQPGVQVLFSSSVAVLWFAYLSEIFNNIQPGNSKNKIDSHIHKEEIVPDSKTPKDKHSKVANRACGLRCFMPYLKSGICTSIIMMIGDLLAQVHVEKTELDIDKLDHKRTLKFGLLGLLFVGPVVSQWSSLSSRFVNRRTPHFERTIVRMINTQLFLAPSLNSGMICSSTIVKDETISRRAMENSFRKNFLNIMEKNYMVWPITQLIQSIVLKPPLRYVVHFVIATFWMCYLSSILMADQKSQQK